VKERLDQRVLGAVRWVDQLTGRPIRRALAVHADGARFRRNAGDLAVLWSARRFARYTATVDPPLPGPEPALPAPPVALTGQVSDPLEEYLPRTFTLALPRHPQAARPWPEDSVFRPVDVALLPGPRARLEAGWAEVRLTLRRADNRAPFPHVLVRAVGDLGDGAGARRLGVGMSDARGEALVVLTRLPLFQPHPVSGKMAPTEVDLTLELVAPPAGQTVVDWTAMLESAADVQTVRHLDDTRRLSLELTVNA
jgi:hypothetical protein